MYLDAVNGFKAFETREAVSSEKRTVHINSDVKNNIDRVLDNAFYCPPTACGNDGHVAKKRCLPGALKKRQNKKKQREDIRVPSFRK